MSHAPKPKPSIADDDTSTYPPIKEHNYSMHRPSTLMDQDTQVYYFKYFRQFWASGPAAAVAVVAGVRKIHGHEAAG